MAVLATAILLLTPVSQMFSAAADALCGVSDFLLAFVPVYAGILTATRTAAQRFACAVGTARHFGSGFCYQYDCLVPLLTIYLAMCMVGSISHAFCIDGITDGVKTVVTVSLGALLTVFVGVLSIKGVLVQGADSVAMKTAKFAAGTVFPVVGGAVSDALSSVQGSLSLMRASVGNVCGGRCGRVMFAAAAFTAAYTACAQFRVRRCKNALSRSGRLRVKSAAGAISLLSGIVAVFAVLVIVSLGILLQTAGG